jgi:hypothetical protein
VVGVKPDIVKRSTSNQNETPETRPDMVGPSIKKCALNRDNSMASNRLKEICFPDQFSQGKFDVTKEVHDLNREMSRSSLGGGATTVDAPSMPPPSGSARTWTQESLPPIQDDDVPFLNRPPSPLERTSTIDRIAEMEVAASVKPEALTAGGRSNTTNTIDEFGEFDDLYDDTINLDDDVGLLRPGRLTDRMTTEDFVISELMNDKSRASPAVGGGGGSGPARPSTLSAIDRMTTTDIMEIMNQDVL